MALQIIEIENGFALKNLHYDMRFEFKRLFPKAIWNSSQKHWEVSKRSDKRLQEFVNTINNEVIELEKMQIELEALSLNENEIFKLENELHNLTQILITERNRKLSLSESLKKIKALNLDIEKIKEEIQEERKQLRDIANEVQNKVDAIIDLSAIETGLKLMKNAYFSAHTSANREMWEEGKDIIYNEELKLRAHKLSSKELNKISNFNWNRLDRDNPNNFDYKRIYLLTDVE